MSDKYTNNFVRCVLAAIDVPSLQKSSPSLELNHLLPEIINSVVLGSFCSILLNVSLLTLSIIIVYGVIEGYNPKLGKAGLRFVRLDLLFMVVVGTF